MYQLLLLAGTQLHYAPISVLIFPPLVTCEVVFCLCTYSKDGGGEGGGGEEKRVDCKAGEEGVLWWGQLFVLTFSPPPPPPPPPPPTPNDCIVLLSGNACSPNQLHCYAHKTDSC